LFRRAAKKPQQIAGRIRQAAAVPQNLTWAPSRIVRLPPTGEVTGANPLSCNGIVRVGEADVTESMELTTGPGEGSLE
jgi:hypothetical protein